ncbi:NTP transferase domain-containing protein [Candidatus Cloacimonadota bacterium]
METIILSAGYSSRMGHNKALLDFEGKKIIDILLNKLFPLSTKLFIVLGENFTEVEEYLKQSNKMNPAIDLVYNEDYDDGMFSSIICGFKCVSGYEPVLLQMIDQPFLEQDLYRKLLAFVDDTGMIFQPARMRGNELKPGHPLLFSPCFKNIILTAEKDSNLRDLIKAHERDRKFYLTDDDKIFMNLNTPEDVRKYLNRE